MSICLIRYQILEEPVVVQMDKPIIKDPGWRLNIATQVFQ